MTTNTAIIEDGYSKLDNPNPLVVALTHVRNPNGSGYTVRTMQDFDKEAFQALDRVSQLMIVLGADRTNLPTKDSYTTTITRGIEGEDLSFVDCKAVETEGPQALKDWDRTVDYATSANRAAALAQQAEYVTKAAAYVEADINATEAVNATV